MNTGNFAESTSRLSFFHRAAEREKEHDGSRRASTGLSRRASTGLSRKSSVFKGFFRNEKSDDRRPASANQTPEGRSQSNVRLSSASMQLRALLSSPRRRRPKSESVLLTPKSEQVLSTSKSEKLFTSSPKTASPHDSLDSDPCASEESAQKDNDGEAEDPAIFNLDEPSGLEFAYVDEEDVVPEAPNTIDKRALELFTAQTRVRSLQSEIDNLRYESDKREKEHAAEKSMLQRTLDTFRTQSESARAEVADLTSQLKDTRKRLSRRVREAEEALSEKNSELAAAKATSKKTVSQLRAECEILRAAYYISIEDRATVQGRSPRNGTVPKSKSSKLESIADVSNPSSPESTEDISGLHTNSSGMEAPPVSSAMPPKSPTNSPLTDAYRPGIPCNRPTSPCSADLFRSHSAVAVANPSFSRNQATPRSFTRTQSARTRVSDSSPDVLPHGRRRSANQLADAQRKRQDAHGGQNASHGDNRSKSGRVTVRKSFIQHIHSNQYRNMRIVWYHFLCAPGSNLSRDQFVTAVQKMPVVFEPKERDIDLLRDEICGHSRRDEAMTWTMFVRFYQRTKQEAL